MPHEYTEHLTGRKGCAYSCINNAHSPQLHAWTCLRAMVLVQAWHAPCQITHCASIFRVPYRDIHCESSYTVYGYPRWIACASTLTSRTLQGWQHHQGTVRYVTPPMWQPNVAPHTVCMGIHSGYPCAINRTHTVCMGIHSGYRFL